MSPQVFEGEGAAGAGLEPIDRAAGILHSESAKTLFYLSMELLYTFRVGGARPRWPCGVPTLVRVCCMPRVPL